MKYPHRFLHLNYDFKLKPTIVKDKLHMGYGPDTGYTMFARLPALPENHFVRVTIELCLSKAGVHFLAQQDMQCCNKHIMPLWHRIHQQNHQTLRLWMTSISRNEVVSQYVSSKYNVKITGPSILCRIYTMSNVLVVKQVQYVIQLELLDHFVNVHKWVLSTKNP